MTLKHITLPPDSAYFRPPVKPVHRTDSYRVHLVALLKLPGPLYWCFFW